MHKDREYRFIDIDKIDRSELRSSTKGTCEDVLTDAVLDILQLAEAEGMMEEEVDNVLRRVIDLRAERLRNRFTLHTNED
jgi:hypothetical protein